MGAAIGQDVVIKMVEQILMVDDDQLCADEMQISNTMIMMKSMMEIIYAQQKINKARVKLARHEYQREMRQNQRKAKFDAYTQSRPFSLPELLQHLSNTNEHQQDNTVRADKDMI